MKCSKFPLTYRERGIHLRGRIRLHIPHTRRDDIQVNCSMIHLNKDVNRFVILITCMRSHLNWLFISRFYFITWFSSLLTNSSWVKEVILLSEGIPTAAYSDLQFNKNVIFRDFRMYPSTYKLVDQMWIFYLYVMWLLIHLSFLTINCNRYSCMFFY